MAFLKDLTSVELLLLNMNHFDQFKYDILILLPFYIHV